MSRVSPMLSDNTWMPALLIAHSRNMQPGKVCAWFPFCHSIKGAEGTRFVTWKLSVEQPRKLKISVNNSWLAMSLLGSTSNSGCGRASILRNGAVLMILSRFSFYFICVKHSVSGPRLCIGQSAVSWEPRQSNWFGLSCSWNWRWLSKAKGWRKLSSKWFDYSLKSISR